MPNKRKFLSRTRGIDAKLNHRTQMSAHQLAIKFSLDSHVIKESFRRTGLFPFNPEIVYERIQAHDAAQTASATQSKARRSLCMEKDDVFTQVQRLLDVDMDTDEKLAKIHAITAPLSLAKPVLVQADEGKVYPFCTMFPPDQHQSNHSVFTYCG